MKMVKLLLKLKHCRNVFNLETKLFPCLVDMRFKGVRVDTAKANTLGDDLEKRKKSILKGIEKRTGIKVEIWAADSIQKILNHQKITDYKKTPKSVEFIKTIFRITFQYLFKMNC